MFDFRCPAACCRIILSAAVIWYNCSMQKRDGKTVERLKEYFKANAVEYKITTAFLFGSYASAAEKKESDIDLAVALADEVESDRDAVFTIITNIAYDLSRICGREVDVIVIDREFSKPMLFYNAIIYGTLLFAADREDHISLVLRALEEMEDFSIFGTKWQLEAAEKSLAKAHG